ncbi:MAG: PqqD family protein [Halioglobus sp.]|nr:PqqD family protein [Halioglobus sp.]
MPYHIPERLLLQSVADEKVILDPESGNYYTLDAVGSRMLDLLRSTNSIEQTVARVVAEFDVSAETAGEDLMELLEQMVQHGLVQKTAG